MCCYRQIINDWLVSCCDHPKGPQIYHLCYNNRYYTTHLLEYSDLIGQLWHSTVSYTKIAMDHVINRSKRINKEIDFVSEY